MWVLLLLIMTSDGVVAYDQGLYDNWSECHKMKKIVLEELNGAYRATCVEW